MLLQMTLLHSFLWMCNIPLYMCVCVCACICVCVCVYTHTPHLLYACICQWTFKLLSCPGHCKQCCSEYCNTLTFLNYSFLQIYAQKWDFRMIGQNILRNLHSVILNGYTTLHSHPQCTKVPFSLHPLQHVLFVDFLTITIWQVWSDLICISLTISTVEHHFMCLLAICKSSLEKCLFRCSAHFLIFFLNWVVCQGLPCFLLLNILFLFIAV